MAFSVEDNDCSDGPGAYVRLREAFGQVREKPLEGPCKLKQRVVDADGCGDVLHCSIQWDSIEEDLVPCGLLLNLGNIYMTTQGLDSQSLANCLEV